MDADVSAARDALTERYVDLLEWRQLSLELTYPGITPGSIYADAHRNLVDTLHFEMRVSERIIYELFSAPLKAKLADAHDRIRRAVLALRKNTNWSHFDIKYVKNSKRTAISSISLSRAHAKILMRELEEVEAHERAASRGFLREMLDAVLPILVPNTDEYDQWKTVLKSYNEVVRIMRKVPDIIVGEDGYEQQLQADADNLQYYGDILTDNLIALRSDEVMTNYLHTLRAGHFKEVMMKYGYLCYLSNDAVEYVNGEMSILYHRHGQRGGSSGREDGWRQSKHCESMAYFSARKVLWASGEADRVLDAHEGGAAERRKRSPETMQHVRAARQTAGRGENYREAHANACAGRKAKAARHATWQSTPLRAILGCSP